MKCLKDEQKQYIIPTKNWLKPLEPFILVNTSGLIMITDFIEKEKVIVKITKGKRNDIIKVNKIIKDIPNFLQSYCSFTCLDNFDNINSFCNAKENSGDFVTLEIIKKYKHGSLNKLINILELNEVVNIIKQLLLAQIHIFSKTGFLHNNIHLGNFLIDKKKDTIELKYKIDIENIKKVNINILSNFIPIISDFNESTIYDNNDLTEDEYRKQNTLGKNIFATFNICLTLLKNNKDLIIKCMNDKNSDIEKYLETSNKNLGSYYKKYYDCESYIKRECRYMLAFSSFLINILDNKAINDWY